MGLKLSTAGPSLSANVLICQLYFFIFNVAISTIKILLEFFPVFVIKSQKFMKFTFHKHCGLIIVFVSVISKIVESKMVDREEWDEWHHYMSYDVITL